MQRIPCTQDQVRSGQVRSGRKGGSRHQVREEICIRSGKNTGGKSASGRKSASGQSETQEVGIKSMRKSASGQGETQGANRHHGRTRHQVRAKHRKSASSQGGSRHQEEVRWEEVRREEIRREESLQGGNPQEKL